MCFVVMQCCKTGPNSNSHLPSNIWLKTPVKVQLDLKPRSVFILRKALDILALAIDG